MSPGLPCFYLDGPGFPRPRGDEPDLAAEAGIKNAFSPPTRG